MFPEAQHHPASFAKAGVRIDISCDVRGDLVGPIVRVVIEDSAPVFWAAMPEASINKDGDAGANKDDIRPPANGGIRCNADTVSETKSV